MTTNASDFSSAKMEDKREISSSVEKKTSSNLGYSAKPLYGTREKLNYFRINRRGHFPQISFP